jgi:uncharacterized protein
MKISLKMATVLTFIFLIVMPAPNSICYADGSTKGLIEQYKFDRDFNSSSASESSPVPIEAASSDIAGFMGETERGPAAPVMVKSWAEYQNVFGGYFGSNKYLPYEVKGYFDNGGQKLYVARIADENAQIASIRLLKGKQNALTVNAIGEGTWGNRVAVKVTASKNEAEAFNIEVYYWSTNPPQLKTGLIRGSSILKPTLTEKFENISVDENSDNYFGIKVNGVSNLIKISVENEDSDLIPDSNEAIVFLNKGTDGNSTLDVNDFTRVDTSNSGVCNGLNALGTIDEISILYSPDALEIDGLADAMIKQCEELGNRVVIVDSDKGDRDPEPNADFSSSYAAFYYPWVKINTTEGQQLIPPGGPVAGVYAFTSLQNGVDKAPANELLKGVADTEFTIDNNSYERLNTRYVNAIRNFSSRGILIWGAHTLSNDPEWKYISTRRYDCYINQSIRSGLDWTYGLPDDQMLWDSAKRTVTEFLTREWIKGALKGNKADNAFFVKIDRSVMNQDDIDDGRLVVQIGVALEKPSEFYIITMTVNLSSNDTMAGS